jgi:hypothetical protein
MKVKQMKVEKKKCPECGIELEDAQCACYDEDAWYCEPHSPGQGCANGCITCPECEYTIYDPDTVVRMREEGMAWVEAVDWDAEAAKLDTHDVRPHPLPPEKSSSQTVKSE